MGPIKPGDRFFSVSSNRRPRAAWVVVTKVGRRWADYVVEGHEDVFHWRGRFDMETLVIDGAKFSSPGRVYVTEEEYRETIRRQALWEDLRRQIDRSYRAPENLTAMVILKAADALGFRLKEE